MGNDEFQVPPSRRKEPQRFEPPPWEREAFERLGQEREVADSEGPSQSTVESGQAAPDNGPPEPTEAKAEDTVRTESPEASVASDGARQDASASGPSTSEVELLMAQLRAEEPPANEGYWKVALAVGGAMAVLGAVLMIWAMAAFVVPGGGAVGSFGGTVLLFFGVSFIGGGAWIAFKGLRQRGVL